MGAGWSVHILTSYLGEGGGSKLEMKGVGDINMLLYKSGNYTRYCFVYINFFNFNLREIFKVTG